MSGQTPASAEDELRDALDRARSQKALDLAQRLDPTPTEGP